jgi:hypothetical protein
MRKRVLVGWLTVGLLAMALSAVRATAAEESGVLGHICIRDVKGMVDKVSKLVDKFAPGMGEAMVAGEAKQVLEAAGWAGVDWSKPVSFALLSGKQFGKKEPVPVAIVAVANAEALKALLQEGAKGPKHIEIRGNFAVASDEEAALKTINDDRLRIYTEFPKIAGTADVYLTVYAQRALTEYMPEIEEGLKAAQEQMAGGAAGMPPGMGGPFEMVQKVMKAVLPMAKLVSTEVRRASLTVELKDDSVEIGGRVYAVEGSELGTLYEGQPQKGSDLAKYLPADSVMGFAANMDATKARPLIEKVVKTLAEALEWKPEEQEKILSLMTASTQTGEFAVAMSGKAEHKGFQTVQVVKIEDAQKFREATKAGVEFVMGSNLMAGLRGMGVIPEVKYEAKVREHNGVAVDRITVSFKAPEAPAEKDAPAMPPMMMGGPPKPQITEVATVDTLAVLANNNETGDLLDNAIDRLKGAAEAGLDTSAAFKAAVAAAPQDGSIVGCISFNSFLVKLIEEAAKNQPMIAMMAGGIAKPNPTEPPITAYAFFAKMQGGPTANFMVHVPLQPILDLTQRVQMMMQQMRGGGMGPRPPMKGMPGKAMPKPKDNEGEF